jgi:hypothetical protein
MWARDIEFMLGCWLAVSPFVFAHPASDVRQWAIDFIAAVLVALFALASYARRTQHAHFLTLSVALALIGLGRFGAAIPTPAMQNNIVIGLLLLMFAIVPNHASQPPAAWYGPTHK